jgi:hypothetical protein
MRHFKQRWGVIASLIFLTYGFCFVAAVQAEEKTVKSRAIRHITKVEVSKVGDVEGHVIGISERSGLATFDNGEVATTTTTATFDTIKGNGTHQGYALYNFEDGSTYVAKFQGTSKAIEGGKNAFKGTFEYVSGTGRFAGIKGSGTYTGKRYLPGKAGGDYVVDVTGTYTVPSM